MTNKTIAVIDADMIRYGAGYAGEKRSILTSHPALGEVPYKNRTEFWGRGKKRDGGILSEINKTRDSIYLPEEFTIVDVQTPEPVENVLHTAKLMMDRCISYANAKQYKAFIGKGESFRLELSTLYKYKDRSDIKPVHLPAVTEYLKYKYHAETVTGIEADDACVMYCFKKPNNILVGEDKDYRGCPVNYIDVNNLEEGIINGSQFGRLWVDDKGKTKGCGRLFLYWQTLSGDDSDTYWANIFSDKKWADKSAYKALVNCKTDTEAWQVLVDCYKALYPKTKTVEGWRGDQIEIDWYYVLSEIFSLARMLRFKNDIVVVKDVLDNLKIAY